MKKKSYLKSRFTWNSLKVINDLSCRLPQIDLSEPTYHLSRVKYYLAINDARVLTNIEEHIKRLIEDHERFFLKSDLVGFYEMLKHTFISSSIRSDKIKAIRSDFFKNSISKTIDNVNGRLVELSISVLRAIIKSDDNLEVHKEDIYYWTKIIVSTFRLKGFRSADLNTMILLSTKPLEDNTFPLPEFVRKMTSGDEKDKAKGKIYDEIKNDFTNRLKGISNYFDKSPFKVEMALKVNNVLCGKGKIIDFEYGEFKFRSPNHYDFRKVKNKLDRERRKNLFASFFDNDNRIVMSKLVENRDFEILLNEHSQSFLEASEVLRINDSVNPECDFSNILSLTENDFGSYGRSVASDNIEAEKYIEIFKINPYEFFGDKRGDLINRLLFAERFYLKARKTNSLYDYWQYFEVLIPSPSFGQNQIKDFVSKFLCGYYINEGRKVLKNNFEHFLFMTGLPVDRSNANNITYIEYLRKKEYLSRKDIKPRKNPRVLFTDFMYISNCMKSESLLKTIESKLYSLMSELYELRNGFIHIGKHNLVQSRRLENQIPKICEMLRFRLILAASKKKSIKFQELIDNL
ncbi:hypothetical protein CEQ90_20320 [Lewinellaceae bacterium SD302]|nr:hypothetical protein CEQ90_20320 [Lewinellaceae bacterium SD302]